MLGNYAQQVSATALTRALSHAFDMRVKRHYRSFSNSAAELCFALAAFACGLFDASVWLTALAAISMLAYWTVTRNSVLNRLRGATWATVMTFGFVVIISIQVGCYWLGLVAAGLI